MAKVTRQGRRQYEPASKARLVDACLEPGASVAGLALQHEVNANLLRKWIVKRQRQVASGQQAVAALPDGGTFVRVVSSADRGAIRVGAMAGTAITQPSLPRVVAEMPNGVRLTLEGRDMQMLAAMIDALGNA